MASSPHFGRTPSFGSGMIQLLLKGLATGEVTRMGLGANVHYSTMRPQELLAYREHEREKMEKKLNEYVLICRQLKVNCNKETIQNDDITKGIIELISLHGITKLVVGAVSDKNYSKAMKAPTSKTALKIMEGAASSCKIWFTCKGSLIFTREANAEVPALPSSPTATNTAPLPVFNISSQMRSIMIHKLENKASSSNVSTMNDMRRSRRDVPCSQSGRTGGTLPQPFEDAESTFNRKPRRPWSSEDFSVDSDRSQNSCCSSSPNDGPVSIYKTEAVDNNDISENGSNMHLSTDDSYDNISATPHELDKLKEALSEIQFLKKEVQEECNERRNAERELHSALQKASVLSTVRHPNLVTLIGTCPEAFGLVYEFFPNDSLEDRLACKNNTPPLTWQTRTRITGEMCSALIFLHSNKPHPVVHGDLKPDNILLDANYSSKLGDFGICRLLIQTNTCSTTLYRTTNPRGTFSYMDPEFLTTGELTPRSDVYSFGIIILRLLTGKQPQRIAEIVEQAIEQGNLDSIIDNSAGSWPFIQANQLAHIGLRCAELSRRRRPDLTVDVWKVVEPLMKAASMTAQPLSGTNLSDDTSIPSYFICPILQGIMNDPYIAADGFTYEGEAIKGWLDSGHSTSPMTNLKLEHSLLAPNRALRSAILEWQQQEQH
ncbi:U-box domain-containing protein 33-like [Panicum miliaceum]|uniref:RING-type E3 ubiquitin transferase n=1 Tax=Panicum miliaceum TaxID=4540 RepID=A0A3L6PTX9_PANMI|nr:U-box domain-containing protein 33-like [Panicum miliaceum]